jgi:predicted nucleotidyltransferase
VAEVDGSFVRAVEHPELDGQVWLYVGFDDQHPDGTPARIAKRPDERGGCLLEEVAAGAELPRFAYFNRCEWEALCLEADRLRGIATLEPLFAEVQGRPDDRDATIRKLVELVERLTAPVPLIRLDSPTTRLYHYTAVVMADVPEHWRERIAQRGSILRAIVGSTLHGLAMEGTDDRDEMGVCVEPPWALLGLRQFEQWVYRTQPEGVRSGPGDLDLTIYGLRKYVRLALNGNPSILTLLFAPPSYCKVRSWRGVQLQALAPAFYSRRAGDAFLGYMRQQRERLEGKRGQMNVKRPELVERHGYDTKYAAHMLRLGLQGVEYMETGQLTLPLPEPVAEDLRSIRRGGWSLPHVLNVATEMEADLARVTDGPDVPPAPDYGKVETWMLSIYRGMWDNPAGTVPWGVPSAHAGDVPEPQGAVLDRA